MIAAFAFKLLFINSKIPDTPSHLLWEKMAGKERVLNFLRQLRIIFRILYILTQSCRININNIFSPKDDFIKEKEAL